MTTCDNCARLARELEEARDAALEEAAAAVEWMGGDLADKGKVFNPRHTGDIMKTIAAAIRALKSTPEAAKEMK